MSNEQSILSRLARLSASLIVRPNTNCSPMIRTAAAPLEAAMGTAALDGARLGYRKRLGLRQPTHA